jgi:hypothetical protein
MLNMTKLTANFGVRNFIIFWKDYIHVSQDTYLLILGHPQASQVPQVTKF